MLALALALGLGHFAAPTPCDGPALPLHFLDGCKMDDVQCFGGWNRGIDLEVSFHFVSKESLDDTIADYLKETGDKPAVKVPVGDASDGELAMHTHYGEAWTRQAGSVSQHIEIYTWPEALGADKVTTQLRVTESVDPTGPLPARWYRKAISPSPPAPMIDVPFLQGRKADVVSIASFEGLMSSAGAMYMETDAQVYRAYLYDPYDFIEQSAKAWALKNGYSRTPSTSFFRAGSGCFEFVITPPQNPPGKPPITMVTMYVSDKKAEHPIARIKD
jgi:hypothetical protein